MVMLKDKIYSWIKLLLHKFHVAEVSWQGIWEYIISAFWENDAHTSITIVQSIDL